ncbi:MAG TPA: glycoside hydrolase family 2 protein, partial [Devosia sp.]|nr:glycoside hydrolase family 2 protein [Devosia sp.]
MRSVTTFNDGWLFEGKEVVTLPHTAVELPFAYFDETAYQRPFTYSKTFGNDPAWAGKEVSLVFDGAMANARVLLNGAQIAAHTDGYTPFEARLTGKLKAGDNTITVTIDGSENPAIPPFGGQIDYLTYAGIYRDVWLKVTAPVSIGSVKIETPDALAAKKSVRARIDLSNPANAPIGGTLAATLRDP